MDGPAFAARLVDTGGTEISQILIDGSGIGTQFGGDSTLWRMDLQAVARTPAKVRGIPWTDRLVQVSPDGQLIAFATNRNGPTQIWISRLDGSKPRILVPGIPPFGAYGDKTAVESVSWSPDGKWIALATGPGVGHGVDDTRVFLVPAEGGRLRILVDLCSGIWDPTPWSGDSQSAYIVKEDENYKASYFQVDIVSGKQTALPEPPSRRGDIALPPGAEEPHFVQNGRFVYFSMRESDRPHIVAIRNLLARPAPPRNDRLRRRSQILKFPESDPPLNFVKSAL